MPDNRLPLHGGSDAAVYVTPAVERQFKLARAYKDVRVVLEATWPPRYRPFERSRHREAIRRLVALAQAAGINPDGWRGGPDA